MGHNFYTFLYGKESINCKLFLIINQAANPVFDVLMPLFTWLGDSRHAYLYLVVLCAVYLAKQDIIPFRYIAVYAVATFCTLLIVEGLKGCFHVPRPAAALGVDHVRVLVELKLRDSIPSGHATFSFMTATVLGHKRSRSLEMPLFLFALLVAYSRIYVGAHYPFDVVASAVLGIAIGSLTWKGYEKLTEYGWRELFQRKRPQRKI
jgi:undecaprenyl-diphosphatase